MKRTLLFGLGLAVAVLALAVVPASSEPEARPITQGDIEGPFHWGGVSNVTKLRHLYFAGKPDASALKAARDAGVRVVINLQAPSELDWDEEASVKALGMTYVNVPLDGRKFSSEAIDQIEAVVAGNRGVPTLIHCSSSNRVGGWLATHLVTQHASPIDDALAIGRKAGITMPFIESAVRDYLASTAHPSPPPNREEK